MRNQQALSQARSLVHDVGKYVARTARNVKAGDWNADVTAMLLADLYDLRGERALRKFLRLAPAGSSPLASLPEWATAHALLCQLDGMEKALRERVPNAPAIAAQHALEVEQVLRSLLARVERNS